LQPTWFVHGWIEIASWLEDIVFGMHKYEGYWKCSFFLPRRKSEKIISVFYLTQ
jgi:hypothetical protein